MHKARLYFKELPTNLLSLSLYPRKPEQSSGRGSFVREWRRAREKGAEVRKRHVSGWWHFLLTGIAGGRGLPQRALSPAMSLVSVGFFPERKRRVSPPVVRK